MGEIDMSSLLELRCCPFCQKGELTIYTNLEDTSYWIHCRECLANGPAAGNVKAAIVRWNVVNEARDSSAVARSKIRTEKKNEHSPRHSESKPAQVDKVDVKDFICVKDYYSTESRYPIGDIRSGWGCGGLCPFHDDRNKGNFRINWDSGAFKCFACGAKGGDIIAYHMMKGGVDFKTALFELADMYGIGKHR